MRAILVITSLLIGGCSFATAHSTPSSPANSCEGYTPAALDVVVAGALVALAVGAPERTCTEIGNCDTADFGGGKLAAVAALGFGVSALHGLTTEQTCRRRAARAAKPHP